MNETFYGVEVWQDESGRFFARGHVDPRRMVGAVHAYGRVMYGLSNSEVYEPYGKALTRVQHLYARPATPKELADRGWEWGWLDIKPELFDGAELLTTLDNT